MAAFIEFQNLTALSNGEWRVVIGEDAQAVDMRIRNDPWTAYD